MRIQLTHLPAVARAAGLLIVAIAMIAAALHFRAPTSRIGVQRPKPLAVDDPLAAELKRCEVIAEQAKDDPACEKAWAENRRRFFTYTPSPAPAHPKSNGR
jgi:conjugative transfer region protein TrbK